MEQPLDGQYYNQDSTSYQDSTLQSDPKGGAWQSTQIYRLAGQIDPSSLISAPSREASTLTRRPTDPKSYASRVQTRPELSVDTAPPTLADAAPISASNDYGSPLVSPPAGQPTRKGSVADKSPLQKLEVALGDVSKEAKRARVQEAEQLAEERRASQSDRSTARTSGQTQRTSSSATDNAARADPVDGPSRRSTSGTDGRSRDLSGSRTYKTRGSTANTQRMSRDLGTRDMASSTSRGIPSKTRQYGHDALLSGTAAAAALGAYQSSRGSRFAMPPISPSPDYNANRSLSVNIPTSSRDAQQTEQLTNRSVSMRGFNQPQQYYGQTQPPKRAATLGTSTTQPNRGLKVDRWVDDSDPMAPPEEYLFQEGNRQYSDAPRMKPIAAPRVAFAPDQSREIDQNREPLDAERDGSQSQPKKHRFWSHDDGETRRYQSTRALEEWKGAGVAYLTSEDLELDATRGNDQPWWERSASNTKNKGPQMDTQTNTSAYGAPKANGEAQTAFEPNLFLKCGPLLRYTGIRQGAPGNDGAIGRETWRGSIMIVTEDAKSSYDVPPILRLFKQSEQLASPRPHHTEDPQNVQHPTDRYDPIAGSTKISRQGETLLVKPVHLLQPEKDLSQLESNEGLFELSEPNDNAPGLNMKAGAHNGETLGKYREVQGFRLHVERGFTFWRFNIQVDLAAEQTRIAYRINQGPATGFWIPAAGQAMNIMFHSCNGFSMSVNPDEFSGPDPLWRDVLNEHLSNPFHVMIGGGDQIYNDAAMKHTTLFQEWLGIKNPEQKHAASFSEAMQNELDQFYLDRYARWFSQGLFGLANSQIPMINVWDDHDIIDGFGSYPHHFMSTPVFSGIGAVAFKYYCLFQHQSVPSESYETEPSWLLGAAPGPYIKQLSRSLFMSLGKGISFLGIDCRTERKRDEILSQGSWDLVFDRCRQELNYGETKHLVVLLGVPIAYPRLNFLENILTSKAMDPIKALARAGLFSGFINRFDSGVEILDDLNDHWTAKHHKKERDWFIQELQELAAEKSVRITILGGDVHLGACGRFYSNPKLGIPKDRDHRYMPNVISSAIVNTPPPDMMADIINKRDKVHKLDHETDEDMIPLFTMDVDGKPRNNNHLLPRRNWCSIREYDPSMTPPPTPPLEPEDQDQHEELDKPKRTLSLGRGNTLKRKGGNSGSLFRRLTLRGRAPPSSYIEPGSTFESSDPTNHETQSLNDPYSAASGTNTNWTSDQDQRRYSTDGVTQSREANSVDMGRRPSFHRRASDLSEKDLQKDISGRQGHVDLERGLDIVLHFEINRKDPLGATVPYRLLIPALFYQGVGNVSNVPARKNVSGIFGLGRLGSQRRRSVTQGQPYEANAAYDAPPLGGRAGGDPITNGGMDRSLETGYPPSTTRNSSRPQTGVSESSARGIDGNEQPEEAADAASSSPAAAAATSQAQHNVPSMGVNGASGTQPVDDVSYTQPIRRNLSAKGPRPPKNLKDLPASVQKRYSQYEPIDDDTDYGSGSNTIPIPSHGLGPPLGKVNNRFQDEEPRELKSSAVGGWDAEPLMAGHQAPTPNNAQSGQDTSRRSMDVNQLIVPAAHGRGKSRGHSRSASLRTSAPTIVTPLFSDDVEANIPQRAATYHAPSALSSQYAPVPGPLTSAPVSAADTYLPPQYHDASQARDSYDSRGSFTPSPPLSEEKVQSRPSKFERHYGGLDGASYNQSGTNDDHSFRPSGEEKRKSTRFSSFVRRFSNDGTKRRS